MDIEIENFSFKEFMYMSIFDGGGENNSCQPPMLTTATCSMYRVTMSMGVSLEIISS